MRATALLWGNNRDIDAATFSECVPSNDDRRQVGGRLCAHQGTPHKEERLTANYSNTLLLIVTAAKAVKGPWKFNHIHIHTQRGHYFMYQSRNIK